ncbi:PD-(D/E)XK nuclease family protein [Desulfofundulus thermocisternus]|uniref:PD-(D/E)XK nuclease family protein n=1 Tax=Desulfofundulus thermocisternus TaxID=42471 RepID=UPI00217CDD2D|nr:PD-(D/E)XK nuclease family protein [Desulfofundulus thermocisternus]MCS5696965.1 PD-(D/E)XK nuclease family protein [Desulfofundulus thermocisternus]
MNVFSFSRIEMFACPARWHRHYVLKLSEPPTGSLVLGKVCHSVIQMAALTQRLDEEFFRQAADVISANAPLKVDPDEVFNLTYQPLVLEEISAGGRVEDHLTCPVNEEPFSPQIQAYIDLWRPEVDYISLVDWKTGYKMYSPEDTMQLKLYSWLLSRNTGTNRVRARLVFLRHRQVEEEMIGPSGMKMARDWAEEKINEIIERLIRIERGEPHQEVFPAVPGDTCRTCGWAYECIDGVLPPVPGEIKTMRQAEQLAAEILRLEAALEQMKALLKGYVKTAGPVVVGSRQFCETTSVSWDFSKEALKAAVGYIAKKGDSIYDHITLSSKKLKKLGWSDAFIASLGAEKKVTKKFTHVAVKNPGGR